MPVPISCDSCLGNLHSEHNCHGNAACKLTLRRTHLVRDVTNKCAAPDILEDSGRDGVCMVRLAKWGQCRQEIHSS